MTSLQRYDFDDLNPELAGMLGAKYERLGYLGEFFQVAAAQPDALAGFVRFSDSLKAALPNDLTEVIALTIAAETDNSYERDQHERLSLKQGHSKEWVLDVERRAPDTSTQLDERQLAVQRLVLSMIRDFGRGASTHLKALSGHLQGDEIVAVMLMACRYIGHTSVVNALELTSPVGSPFTETSDQS